MRYAPILRSHVRVATDGEGVSQSHQGTVSMGDGFQDDVHNNLRVHRISRAMSLSNVGHVCKGFIDERYKPLGIALTGGETNQPVGVTGDGTKRVF
jgi:hypothetical protein